MRWFFALLLACGAVLVHSWTWGSLRSLRRVREAQRVPLNALQPGPAVVFGRATEGSDGLVGSRYFEQDCLYYRCTLTEEYRDSDGDRRTRTLETYEDGVRFLLEDRGVEILVQLPEASYCGFRVKNERQQGQKTWTEVRLDPGEPLHAYGIMQGDFEALEREAPLELAPDAGVLRLTTLGEARLHGIDQLYVIIYGLLGGALASCAVGLGLPALYRSLRRKPEA